ncbi:hypothetical protein chiPu_0000725 [Chiloscyllium punctatum]|uniref:FHA domain-containing protein n=1 Tax=Chiloscyllium punctatum TaxID=137246 RepID=A0A401RW08_CHIPU|nr:hypothetical protein [Chiloscyllium punctatum]
MPLYGKIVVIKRTGADGYNFPLTSSSCLFGRKTDCDIRIQLPHVSKEHCKLEVNENNEVILTNLSEVNRTHLNGNVVLHSERLKHHDVFTVIDRSFRFEYPLDSVHNTSPRKRRSLSSLRNETLQVLHVQQGVDDCSQSPGNDHRSTSGRKSDEILEAPTKSTKATPNENDSAPKAARKRSSSKVLNNEQPADEEHTSPFSKLYEMFKHEVTKPIPVKPNKENTDISVKESSTDLTEEASVVEKKSDAMVSQFGKNSQTSPSTIRVSGRRSKVKLEEGKMKKDNTYEKVNNLESLLVEGDVSAKPTDINCAKQNNISEKLNKFTDNPSFGENATSLTSFEVGVKGKDQNHLPPKCTPNVKQKSQNFTTPKSLTVDEAIKKINENLDFSMEKGTDVKTVKMAHIPAHEDKERTETPKKRGRSSLRNNKTVQPPEIQPDQVESTTVTEPSVAQVVDMKQPSAHGDKEKAETPKKHGRSSMHNNKTIQPPEIQPDQVDSTNVSEPTISQAVYMKQPSAHRDKEKAETPKKRGRSSMHNNKTIQPPEIQPDQVVSINVSEPSVAKSKDISIDLKGARAHGDKEKAETPKKHRRSSSHVKTIQPSESEADQVESINVSKLSVAKLPVSTKPKRDTTPSSLRVRNNRRESNCPTEAECLEKTCTFNSPHRFLTSEQTEKVVRRDHKSPMKTTTEQLGQFSAADVGFNLNCISKESSSSPGAILHSSKKRRSANEENVYAPIFKRKRVSFGANLSPELFDKRMPPSSPLRKGGTPTRVSTPFRSTPRTVLKRASSVGIHSCTIQEFNEQTENDQMSPRRSCTLSEDSSRQTKKSPVKKSSLTTAKKSPVKGSPLVKTPMSSKIAPLSTTIPSSSSSKKSSVARPPSQSTSPSSITKKSSVVKALPTSSPRQSVANKLPSSIDERSFDCSPRTRGRFSISHVATPSLNRSKSPRFTPTSPDVALFRKSEEKTDLMASSGKSSSRKRTRRSGLLLAAVRTRRQTGASAANLFVKKSWAQIVKEGVAKPQLQCARKKSAVVQKRTKNTVSLKATPVHSVKGHCSTGHAASPATIVIGKSQATTIKPTGQVPRVIRTVSLRRKDYEMDESLSGMAEMFSTPTNENVSAQPVRLTSDIVDNSQTALANPIAQKSFEESIIKTPEETGVMSVSPLSTPGQSSGKYNNSVSRLLRCRVDFSSGINDLYKNITKVKGKPVQDMAGIKRIMKTPRVKGQPVEDMVGIKRIMRSPRVKSQPVEDMVGIKRIMKTPRVKGKPVEDMVVEHHDDLQSTSKKSSRQTCDNSSLTSDVKVSSKGQIQTERVTSPSSQELQMLQPEQFETSHMFETKSVDYLESQPAESKDGQAVLNKLILPARTSLKGRKETNEIGTKECLMTMNATPNKSGYLVECIEEVSKMVSTRKSLAKKESNDDVQMSVALNKTTPDEKESPHEPIDEVTVLKPQTRRLLKEKDEIQLIESEELSASTKRKEVHSLITDEKISLRPNKAMPGKKESPQQQIEEINVLKSQPRRLLKEKNEIPQVELKQPSASTKGKQICNDKDVDVKMSLRSNKTTPGKGDALHDQIEEVTVLNGKNEIQNILNVQLKELPSNNATPIRNDSPCKAEELNKLFSPLIKSLRGKKIVQNVNSTEDKTEAQNIQDNDVTDPSTSAKTYRQDKRQIPVLQVEEMVHKNSRKRLQRRKVETEIIQVTELKNSPIAKTSKDEKETQSIPNEKLSNSPLNLAMQETSNVQNVELAMTKNECASSKTSVNDKEVKDLPVEDPKVLITKGKSQRRKNSNVEEPEGPKQLGTTDGYTRRRGTRCTRAEILKDSNVLQDNLRNKEVVDKENGVNSENLKLLEKDLACSKSRSTRGKRGPQDFLLEEVGQESALAKKLRKEELDEALLKKSVRWDSNIASAKLDGTVEMLQDTFKRTELPVLEKRSRRGKSAKEVNPQTSLESIEIPGKAVPERASNKIIADACVIPESPEQKGRPKREKANVSCESKAFTKDKYENAKEGTSATKKTRQHSESVLKPSPTSIRRPLRGNARQKVTQIEEENVKELPSRKSKRNIAAQKLIATNDEEQHVPVSGTSGKEERKMAMDSSKAKVRDVQAAKQTANKCESINEAAKAFEVMSDAKKTDTVLSGECEIKENTRPKRGVRKGRSAKEIETKIEVENAVFEAAEQLNLSKTTSKEATQTEEGTQKKKSFDKKLPKPITNVNNKTKNVKKDALSVEQAFSDEGPQIEEAVDPVLRKGGRGRVKKSTSAVISHEMSVNATGKKQITVNSATESEKTKTTRRGRNNDKETASVIVQVDKNELIDKRRRPNVQMQTNGGEDVHSRKDELEDNGKAQDPSFQLVESAKPPRRVTRTNKSCEPAAIEPISDQSVVSASLQPAPLCSSKRTLRGKRAITETTDLSPKKSKIETVTGNVRNQGRKIGKGDGSPKIKLVAMPQPAKPMGRSTRSRK